ncbi:SagB/ThcOx family dehydrogenase [Tissierella sp. DSM 105185]|uniref:SagB/ThcOx family dehydrogenase n=1 Tax=Tissierella pigra TaxID=2607614 RepID=A0A6N7XXE5_9FIRM|nr:SagB/ThcOx family dehydrogenase [Tissierella pigra]
MCYNYYTRFKDISYLCSPFFILSSDQINSIQVRRTKREFSKQPISLMDFTKVLFYSSFVTGRLDEFMFYPKANLTPYASSGAIDSMYLFVTVLNVEELEAGIYLYNNLDNSLYIIKDNFSKEEYNFITANEHFCYGSSFNIYIVGDMSIKGMKYQDRAYRFLNIEAGHLAQNICLICEGLGIGVISSGGFYDDIFLEYINIDIGEKYLLYELILGMI